MIPTPAEVRGRLVEGAEAMQRAADACTDVIDAAAVREHLAVARARCDLVERDLIGMALPEMPVDAGDHPLFAQKAADARTQLRVNAAVVLRDAQGRIMLEKRADCRMWGVPGGRVEPGESIADAARREILEETGLDIRVTRLLGVYSGPGDRILSFPDNVVHVIDVLVEAEVLSGTLVLSAESEAMEFFSLSALPRESAIIPPARRLLADVVSGRTGMVL